MLERLGGLDTQARDLLEKRLMAWLTDQRPSTCTLVVLHFRSTSLASLRFSNLADDRGQRVS